MKTYKYKFGSQSNCIRIGNLLDDMWQVHEYFHKWQRQRYKDGLPYANYSAMCAQLTELKRTLHPHWNVLPSQAIQEELKRIDAAYQRFFNRLGGRPKIKKRLVTEISESVKAKPVFFVFFSEVCRPQ